MIKLRGSTLQELLVAMILIGMLYLSVMEGYVLMKRFCVKVTSKMEKSMDSLNTYYQYNRYTMSADTLIVHDTINLPAQFIP